MVKDQGLNLERLRAADDLLTAAAATRVALEPTVQDAAATCEHTDVRTTFALVLQVLAGAAQSDEMSVRLKSLAAGGLDKLRRGEAAVPRGADLVANVAEILGQSTRLARDAGLWKLEAERIAATVSHMGNPLDAQLGAMWGGLLASLVPRILALDDPGPRSTVLSRTRDAARSALEDVSWQYNRWALLCLQQWSERYEVSLKTLRDQPLRRFLDMRSHAASTLYCIDPNLLSPQVARVYSTCYDRNLWGTVDDAAEKSGAEIGAEVAAHVKETMSVRRVGLGEVPFDLDYQEWALAQIADFEAFLASEDVSRQAKSTTFTEMTWAAWWNTDDVNTTRCLNRASSTILRLAVTANGSVNSNTLHPMVVLRFDAARDRLLNTMEFRKHREMRWGETCTAAAKTCYQPGDVRLPKRRERTP
jgi:hypothetical protein